MIKNSMSESDSRYHPVSVVIIVVMNFFFAFFDFSQTVGLIYDISHFVWMYLG